VKWVPRSRRVTFATALIAAVAAVSLLVVPGAIQGATTGNGLSAYVVPTNRGPLPPCSGADCTAANTVWHFIHVVNTNALTNRLTGLNRAAWPNSFAVSSIDEQIFVNGVDQTQFDFTMTPPPNAFLRSWSGHWPSTVTCPSDGTACDVVLNPAVLPGENTAIVYTGWIHGSTEPNGTYVFRYTIHGSLNGDPVDLTASSPPISMTG
jgi:hypothetical protein